MARQEKGGSAPTVSYSGGVTVWGAATPDQCREEPRSLRRTPESIPRANARPSRPRAPWETRRGPGRVRRRRTTGAAVRADLVDEELGVTVQVARAPVRALETLLSLRGQLRRLELAERSGHLVRGQVRTACAVLAEIESVGVAGGEAHHAGSGSPHPDGRPGAR